MQVTPADTAQSSTDDALRVVAARHWLVRMPFQKPTAWGSGVRSGVTRLVVELTSAGGLRGYGETICLLDSIEPVLRTVVLPLAIGKSADEVESLYRHVLGAGYYHHKRAAVMAIAAVEMAMWDLRGKSAGVPLHRLWGGAYRRDIRVAAYLFSGEPTRVGDEARAWRDRGYGSFKIKIGSDPASDLALVEAVRVAIGPQVHLRADVNGAWTVGTAKRQLAKLAAYDLAYIEQPLELDDLRGHAALRAVQSVPIALDESAYTLQDVGNIVREMAADAILLDPHEAGGLWQTVKAAAVAEAVGIPVTLHSGGELGFSQAAYLHLAASIPNMTISIDSERDHLSGDVVRDPPRIVDGMFRIPEGPGLGVEPDLAALDRFKVEGVAGAYLDPARPGWFPVKPAY